MKKAPGERFPGVHDPKLQPRLVCVLAKAAKATELRTLRFSFALRCVPISCRQLPLAQEDLEAAVEMLALLKGLESLLGDCTAWLQPLMHQAMYAHVQQFLQVTIPSWLKPSIPNKVHPLVEWLSFALICLSDDRLGK